jgi:hypothetical protein
MVTFVGTYPKIRALEIASKILHNKVVLALLHDTNFLNYVL